MSSNNRFVFSGLDELKAELRALPDALTREASRHITVAATGAANTVSVEYGRHRRTGRLQNSVKVTQPGAGSYGVAMVVKVNNPIAWLFDNGSQARHYTTKAGKQHGTGVMWGKTPPTHVFARTMAQARRRMYGELRAMLERHGLQVIGDAE